MSRGRVLEVRLHERHVADLEQLPDRRLRLRFTPDALDALGLGSPALSLSLPTTAKRLTGGPVQTWFENLLPEGQARSGLELDLSLGPGDTFGLLRAIGADCAGAVQVLEPGAPPRPAEPPAPLTGDGFDRLVRGLPSWQADVPVQSSLGGIQPKALLVRLPDGQWAIPRGGAPSTHIVKPEPPAQPGAPAGLVSAEHWCLQVAAAAGIPAAVSELVEVRGADGPPRAAIVVARFDRTTSPDGAIRRHHQEDLAQALGLPAARKYETTPEGRLGRAAGLLRSAAADPAAQMDALLELVAANIALGNGDAHAKNYSLLIAQDGTVRVAPLYDAAPLWHLNRRWDATGFAIAGQTHIGLVTPRHLIDEAAGWGIARRRAEAVVTGTYERIAAASAAAPDPPRHLGLGAAIAKRARRELDGAARRSTAPPQPVLPPARPAAPLRPPRASGPSR